VFLGKERSLFSVPFTRYQRLSLPFVVEYEPPFVQLIHNLSVPSLTDWLDRKRLLLSAALLLYWADFSESRDAIKTAIAKYYTLPA
jgi:hypothetical protein